MASYGDSFTFTFTFLLRLRKISNWILVYILYIRHRNKDLRDTNVEKTMLIFIPHYNVCNQSLIFPEFRNDHCAFEGNDFQQSILYVQITWNCNKLQRHICDFAVIVVRPATPVSSIQKINATFGAGWFSWAILDYIVGTSYQFKIEFSLSEFKYFLMLAILQMNADNYIDPSKL
jgi:hypothetical protein